MRTIPQVSHAMQTILTTAAEAAATKRHYTKRPDRAKFTASTLVQTLVLGWLGHPDATVEQLAQNAARVGVAVSPQAIDQRCTFATAGLLQEVLQTSMQHVITTDPVAIPILQRFTGVRVHDSTTIVLPDALAAIWQGCGGRTAEHTAAALKCGIQIDLLTGALCGLDLAHGRASDHGLAIQHTPLPAGSLRLADLGFLDLEVLATIDQQGAYWLSKLPCNSTISTTTQPAQPLLAFVQQRGDTASWEEMVWVGKDARLAARMLVMRVPQEVADQRRRRIRKEYRDKGRTPSAAVVALADWTILITNIPADMLTQEEAMVVIKVRWQIELLFKLWKSQGQINTWRSGKPARILCEVYAKLLAMVLQHGAMIMGCWRFPDRSLVKAAQVVRDHAAELAGACGQIDRLTAVLETIQRVLKHTARMNTRKKHPNTYQFLLALTTAEEQA